MRSREKRREKSRAGPPHLKQLFSFTQCPKKGVRGSEVKPHRERLTSTQGDSLGRGRRQDKHNKVTPFGLSSTERYLLLCMQYLYF